MRVRLFHSGHSRNERGRRRTSRLARRSGAVVALGVSALAPSLLEAQATLRGRVLADSTRMPLAGVEVVIQALTLGARTDSTGAFQLGVIPVGTHELLVRHAGYQPLTARLTVAAGGELPEREFVLLRTVTQLAEVTVVEEEELIPTAKLMPFLERMKLGHGRFLTVKDFAKASRIEEVLGRQVPGMRIVRGKGSVAWVASSRVFSSEETSQIIEDFDVRQGASRRECYSAVLIDGAWAYRGIPREPLFNINTIHPSTIAGVEYYSGTSTPPQAFRAMGGGGCGVIAIWLR